MTRKTLIKTSIALVLLTVPGLVLAHAGHGQVSGGLFAGLLHPLQGLDHLVALLAIGIWGGLLAPSAWRWFIPVTVVGLGLGTVLGLVGVPVPGIEIGILLSILMVGLLMASLYKPPLIVAAVLSGAFMVFHGAAHGQEMQPGLDAMAYLVGLSVTSAAVMGLSMMLGSAFKRATWPLARIAGLGFVITSGALLFT